MWTTAECPKYNFSTKKLSHCLMKLIYPHFERTNKCTIQLKYFIKIVL